MDVVHVRPSRRARQHKGRSSFLLILALLMAAVVLVGTTLKSHVLVTADLRPQGDEATLHGARTTCMQSMQEWVLCLLPQKEHCCLKATAAKKSTAASKPLLPTCAADVLWNLAQHRPRQKQEARRPIDYVQQYGALEASEYPRECQDQYHGLPYFEHVKASWQQPVCEPQVRPWCGRHADFT